MVKFFEKTKISYDYQYWFKEKQYVIHALIYVMSLICDSLQSNRNAGFLLMDFRKRFDTVSHYILLQKFCLMGFAFSLVL